MHRSLKGTRYFQGGEYAGPEHRNDKKRPQLSEENEKLINVFRAIQKSGCGDCPIPEEAKEHVSHVVDEIKNIGDSDIGKGISKGARQYWIVNGLLKTHSYIKRYVIGALITVIITALLSMLVYGFVLKVRGG